MFSKTTPKVDNPRFTKHVKVFLFDYISHPIKMNVYCLGEFLLNFSVHDAITG